MGYTATNISISRESTTSGSSIEASFTLNSRHTVRYRREDKIPFVQQVIHLYIDGSEVLNKTILLLGNVSHSFKLDGVDCLFDYTWLVAGEVGKFEVGGATIF